jgi:hypothetical protein
MYLLSLFMLQLPFVYSDIVLTPIPDNVIDENNIIITTLWAMSVLTSVGLITKFKQKIPLDIKEIKHIYWDEYECDKKYFEINIKDYTQITKLRKNMKELEKILTTLEEEYVAKELEDISEEIRYKCGKGELRFRENDKYYHGVNNTNERNNRKGKIIEGEGWSKCIFEYNSDNKKIKMRIWDTFNANEYCNNCSFDKEKSRGRRVFGVYKCNGHEI